AVQAGRQVDVQRLLLPPADGPGTEQPFEEEDTGAGIEVRRRVRLPGVAQHALEQDELEDLALEGQVALQEGDRRLAVDLDLFQQPDEPIHFDPDVDVERFRSAVMEAVVQIPPDATRAVAGRRLQAGRNPRGLAEQEIALAEDAAHPRHRLVQINALEFVEKEHRVRLLLDPRAGRDVLRKENDAIPSLETVRAGEQPRGLAAVLRVRVALGGRPALVRLFPADEEAFEEFAARRGSVRRQHRRDEKRAAPVVRRDEFGLAGVEARHAVETVAQPACDVMVERPREGGPVDVVADLADQRLDLTQQGRRQVQVPHDGTLRNLERPEAIDTGSDLASHKASRGCCEFGVSHAHLFWARKRSAAIKFAPVDYSDFDRSDQVRSSSL